MVTTLAALRATKTLLTDHTFLFQGAGEAAIGIANLIVMALEKLYEIPRLVKSSEFWRFWQFQWLERQPLELPLELPIKLAIPMAGEAAIGIANLIVM